MIQRNSMNRYQTLDNRYRNKIGIKNRLFNYLLSNIYYLLVFILVTVICYLISAPSTAHASGLIKPANNLGLVGYWSFEDATGTQATDFSGNGNVGALANGPVWTGGKFGKSLSFDSNNDFVLAPALTTQISSGSWSVSTWIKILATSTISRSYLGAYDSSNSGELNFYILANTAKLRLYSQQVGNIESNSSINIGTWNQVTMTSSASELSMYINGQRDYAASSSQLYWPTAGGSYSGMTYIGASGYQDYYFNGSLDDLRIYNRALSATEVAALYNSGGIAKSNSSLNNFMTNGLVGLWSFDGADIRGTTAYDKSGQGNNGALTNGPVVIEGKRGQALKFDGSDDYVNTPQSSGVLAPANAITVSAWVNKPDTTSGDIATVGGAGVWALAATVPNSRIEGSIADNRFYSVETIPTNQWTHIVMTYSADGSGSKIYLNGIQATASAYTGTSTIPASTLDMGIGRSAMEGNFKGSIDDVRVYNRVLSATEIYQLYRAGNLQPNSSIGGITDGLVAWHTFDGPRLNTTTSTDSVNTAYNGTLYGNPVTMNGKVGQAIFFDGADDSLISAGSVALPGNSVSFGAWVKPSLVDGTQNIILDSGSVFGIRLEISDNNNKARIDVGNGGSYFIINLEGTTTIAANNWYHFMGTYDGTTARIYVNGIEENSANNSGTPSIGRLYIGKFQGGASYEFPGYIDDVRVYNRALSAVEVKLLYNSSK